MLLEKYVKSSIIGQAKNERKGGRYLNIDYKKDEKVLCVEITEEIDHHAADKIRRKVDNEITRYMPRKTIFDFSRVTFMDSAGIGMIIGRYKMMKLIGGSLEIENVNESSKKILEMSGILKIVPVSELKMAQ